jgi:hypothetical protein
MVADLDRCRSEAERANLDHPTLARLRAISTQRTTTMSTTSMSRELRAYCEQDDPGSPYRPGGASWFRDVMRVSLGGMDTDGSSMRRLAEHRERIERVMGTAPEYRDLSRVDGSGGYAVPPAWLMNQFIELARPGRAFANLVQRQPLPGGTDSINIPKILSGTATAIQKVDNDPVIQTDLTDTFVNAPVRTIAGQQSVAIQLIDQSPVAFDDVIFRDLVADYSAKLDIQCLTGTGTSGQVLGALNTPGIQNVTLSSVDAPGIYKGLSNAIQLVHTNRFQPPEAIVMHPRRWGWLLSLLDLQQRPLFVPDANNGGSPFNAMGILTDVDSQAVVGRTHGLPIVSDPNIPTNLGPGTNEDCIIVLRASDIVLWESGVRARVLPETKAQNLCVLIQVYGYLAFAASRYAQSLVVLSGGLVPPSF